MTLVDHAGTDSVAAVAVLFAAYRDGVTILTTASLPEDVAYVADPDGRVVHLAVGLDVEDFTDAIHQAAAALAPPRPQLRAVGGDTALAGSRSRARLRVVGGDR